MTFSRFFVAVYAYKNISNNVECCMYAFSDPFVSPSAVEHVFSFY